MWFCPASWSRHRMWQYVLKDLPMTVKRSVYFMYRYWFHSSQFYMNGFTIYYFDRVKRIWYLSPMRAAKVQASLRIRAVSPEPPLLAHTSSESRGTFRQKARSLAPLNGWTCAVKICNDGMLEDTNSLDGAHLISCLSQKTFSGISMVNSYSYQIYCKIIRSRKSTEATGLLVPRLCIITCFVFISDVNKLMICKSNGYNINNYRGDARLPYTTVCPFTGVDKVRKKQDILHSRVLFLICMSDKYNYCCSPFSKNVL